MDTYIAVDIGGTQLRAALFAGGGTQPIVTRKISTQGENQAPVERLMGLIASVWPQEDQVKGIGLAAPGPTNGRAGIIYRAPNIAGWVNVPLTQIAEERFKVRARLGNDANMAALGEWTYGAARGYNHVLYITVSTGIGGGIIQDGRLVDGVYGLAGEIGHVTVDPNGPLCGCGHHGHLETYASGTAIARYVQEQLIEGAESTLGRISNPSARDVSTAAAQGDALAIRALARAGTYLGQGVADFLHILNPEVVVLGGGVSRAGDFLIEPMRTAIAERVIAPEYVRDLAIVQAELGDDCGLMGALALAQLA
jgi:glucokinase